MQDYLWLLSLPSLVLISLLGMILHFFKKKIKGETLADIKAYFHDHFKSTVTAFIITIASAVAYYFSLATGQAADILFVLQIGYMCDSTFNKWDAKETIKNVPQ